MPGLRFLSNSHWRQQREGGRGWKGHNICLLQREILQSLQKLWVPGHWPRPMYLCLKSLMSCIFWWKKKLHPHITFISFTKIHNLNNWNYFSHKIPVFHQELPVILMGRLDNHTPTGGQGIFFRTKSIIRRNNSFWFWRWWTLKLNWGEIHCSKESKTYLLLLWWRHFTKDLNFQYE